MNKQSFFILLFVSLLVSSNFVITNHSKAQNSPLLNSKQSQENTLDSNEESLETQNSNEESLETQNSNEEPLETQNSNEESLETQNSNLEKSVDDKIDNLNTDDSEDIIEWAKIGLSILALIISGISAYLSIKATRKLAGISNEQLKLALRNYDSDRTLILKGYANDENNQLILEPANKSNTFLRGYALFPDIFEIPEQEIKLPDSTLELDILKLPLRQVFRDEIQEEVSREKILFHKKGYVPFLMQSQYTFKGEIIAQRSIYGILYESTIESDNLYNDFDIKFGNLFLIDRIPYKDDENKDDEREIKKIINDFWETLINNKGQ